ncbi:C2 domain-containing protein 5 [Schistosoma japonicum]|nr:C2 domain-containing protein 5 [Schistosoma japonicum]
MPGTVKVKVISARNLPVMDRATFLTDAFVELCIGSITYKTEVVRRSLNPSWNSEWFCFELDDQTLQEEALLLKVMDHDTYSAHDAIGRVYFDLNPLLSRGQTRCLNGWFPIYDTMHGIRGEICLAIRVDVFLDASRYHQSSLGVRFYHCCTIPQGFVIDSLIGFIQELVMNDDPEHQWIEKIRTSRASNEARQRLFSRLSGELQRKIGLKVLNLGGNSLIGYQLHFDLEGETGVVVRGIGTAVRLKKYNPVTTPPNTPTGMSKNCSLIRESPNAHKEYIVEGVYNFPIHIPQTLELGEFPFLTITQPLPGMILHFGSLIASKSVQLLDKNSPAGIQFRDAWWLELRTEMVSHMRSIGCDAVLAYREECTIYEDVCILSSYGTAVQINPKWINNSSHKIGTTNPLGHTSATLEKASEKMLGSMPTSNHFTTRDQCSSNKPCTRSYSPELTTVDYSHHLSSSETTPVPSPTSSHNKGSFKKTTPDRSLPHKQIFRNLYNPVKPDCHICHLPSTSDTNSNRLMAPVTSSRCAVCKMGNVPDLLFSSSDFPLELMVTGNPALIQARVCRSKKDTKGEVAASELSEILPFIDYELHYRLMQKLRLRSMNGLFGLRYRIAVGEYMIAAIATGTGVCISALPSPPPPRIIPSLPSSPSADDLCGYEILKKQVDEYLKKSRQLYRISDTVYQSNLSKFEVDTHYNNNHYTVKDYTDNVKQVEDQLHQLCFDNLNDYDKNKQSNVTSDLINSLSNDDTLFLETREPEVEELAVLLQDPFQPQGLILTTTESIPISNGNIESTDDVAINNSKVFIHPSMTMTMNSLSECNWNQFNSFVRLHETELSIPDSFFETSVYSMTTTPNVAASTISPPSFSNESNLIPTKKSLSHSIHMITTNTNSMLSSTISPSSITKSHGYMHRCDLTHSNSGTHLHCTHTTVANDNNTSRNNHSTSLINSGQTSASTFASSPSSSPSVNSLITHNNIIIKGRQYNLYTPPGTTSGNSLGKALREFNQLTWFRFRHYIPCMLNALDYRLSFTDDEHLQIIATGMILRPNISSIMNSNENQHSLSIQYTNNNPMMNDCSSSTPYNNHNSNSVDKDQVDDNDGDSKERKESMKRRSKFYLHKPALLTKLKSDLKSMNFIKIGGVSGFLHTSLTEVQAVVGAHTTSLGGNALLSYHLSEVVVLRPTSRNQAQCLLNVCGDMARLSWGTVKKSSSCKE